jgi:uncharacterized membrane protein
MAQASDHHRGDMDIHEQVYTYRLFGRLTKWGSLITAVAVLFLTMWFCAGAGFIGSAVTGLVVLALGILVLRDRKGGGH